MHGDLEVRILGQVIITIILIIVISIFAYFNHFNQSYVGGRPGQQNIYPWYFHLCAYMHFTILLVFTAQDSLWDAVMVVRCVQGREQQYLMLTLTVQCRGGNIPHPSILHTTRKLLGCVKSLWTPDPPPAKKEEEGLYLAKEVDKVVPSG
ncbi:hypothetical protein BDZ91DRAFT_763991 [Kalaharituber pfeilii]|nr:hypothetical protein BDZ91DRAFT_763991 [Kalaharituber pfeilii]